MKLIKARINVMKVEESTFQQQKVISTILDEWSLHGVKDAFISPGSRSTPIIVAIEQNGCFESKVSIDERTTSFAALGNSLVTKEPSLLVCTSGTASAHFLAAIIEAHYSQVPLIIFTADRPLELHDVGAPQTIKQTEIYKNFVRYSVNLDPSQNIDGNAWRAIASRIAIETKNNLNPGPVHVNIQLREPFYLSEPQIVKPFPRKSNTDRWHTREIEKLESKKEILNNIIEQTQDTDGIIFAGYGNYDNKLVNQLAEKLNWPIFSDPRVKFDSENNVINFNWISQTDWINKHKPKNIIQIGNNLTSKNIYDLIKSSDTTFISANDSKFEDQCRLADTYISFHDLAFLIAGLNQNKSPSWLKSWKTIDQQFQRQLDDILGKESNLNGPQITKTVSENVVSESQIFVGSSMPIREFEWFSRKRIDINVYANRGANGIDGSIATSSGLAQNKQTYALIGDIAFEYDFSTLMNPWVRQSNLKIFVIDNKGGQIFSHLPQEKQLQNDTFSRYFLTPTEINIKKVCESLGITTHECETKKQLADVFKKLDQDLEVIVCKSVSDNQVYEQIKLLIEKTK